MPVERSALFQLSPSADRNPPRKDYSLPDNHRIVALVNQIEIDGPRGFIKPNELQEMAQSINAETVIKTLPEGLTEEDFIGILKLSLLTECATDTYAKQFNTSSRQYNQPWLGRFTSNVWTPDELMHHLPFKSMLMQLGHSEDGLDKEIKEAREKDYIHGSGNTPVHLTTFGMIQEYFTDNWYGLTHAILRPAAPKAAHMVGRVKGRETLHTVWYRDITALQIEENPQLIPHVAETLMRFQMPGNEIVPDLQTRASDWLPRMGANLAKVKKDIVRLSAEAVNSPANAGRLILEIAAQQGRKLGPFKATHVRSALNRLGDNGYGIVGEGILEGMGIKGPYRDLEAGIGDKIRGTLRTWVAGKFDALVNPTVKEGQTIQLSN